MFHGHYQLLQEIPDFSGSFQPLKLADFSQLFPNFKFIAHKYTFGGVPGDFQHYMFLCGYFPTSLG